MWLRNFQDPEGQVALWLLSRTSRWYTDPAQNNQCRCPFPSTLPTVWLERIGRGTSSQGKPQKCPPNLQVVPGLQEFHSSQNAVSLPSPCLLAFREVAVLSCNPCGHNNNICCWKMAFSITIGRTSLAGDSTRSYSLSYQQQLVTDVLTELHNSATAGHLGVKKTHLKKCTQDCIELD